MINDPTPPPRLVFWPGGGIEANKVYCIWLCNEREGEGEKIPVHGFPTKTTLIELLYHYLELRHRILFVSDYPLSSSGLVWFDPVGTIHDGDRRRHGKMQ